MRRDIALNYVRPASPNSTVTPSDDSVDRLKTASQRASMHLVSALQSPSPVDAFGILVMGASARSGAFAGRLDSLCVASDWPLDAPDDGRSTRADFTLWSTPLPFLRMPPPAAALAVFRAVHRFRKCVSPASIADFMSFAQRTELVAIGYFTMWDASHFWSRRSTWNQRLTALPARISGDRYHRTAVSPSRDFSVEKRL